MKKLIVLSLFLLTGCTADYNLTLDEEYRVYESFTVSASNRIISDGHSGIDEGLNSKISNNYSVPGFSKFKYEFIKGQETSGIKFSRSYVNLDAFKEGLTFSYLFKYYDIVENKNEVTFNFYFNKEENMFLEATSYDTALKSVDIKIKIPFYIVNGNYDKNEGSVMTWNYNPNVTKDIRFTINKNITVYGEKIESKNYDKFIIYGIIALFMAVVIGFISYIFINKSNYNKF